MQHHDRVRVRRRDRLDDFVLALGQVHVGPVVSLRLICIGQAREYHRRLAVFRLLDRLRDHGVRGLVLCKGVTRRIVDEHSLAGFDGAGDLESIDMGMFDFSSATKLERMFYGCSKLKTVDLSKAEWGSSTPDAYSMFCYCEGLQELTVPAEFKPETANSMLFVDFDDTFMPCEYPAQSAV